MVIIILLLTGAGILICVVRFVYKKYGTRKTPSFSVSPHSIKLEILECENYRRTICGSDDTSRFSAHHNLLHKHSQSLAVYATVCIMCPKNLQSVLETCYFFCKFQNLPGAFKKDSIKSRLPQDSILAQENVSIQLTILSFSLCI